MIREPKSYPEKVLLRERCNSVIHHVVGLYRNLFPSLRYIQILWCLNIIDQTQSSILEDSKVIDRFSEEPYDTVVRILPLIIELINKHFPEKPQAQDRVLRTIIIMNLEKLELAKRIPGSFKIRMI